MPVPYAIARFNKRVTNRFIEPVVRRFGGYAVVHHTGRRSGRHYQTPVYLFPLTDHVNVDDDDVADVIVVMTYGLRADWCRNVLAGGGAVERRGLSRTIGAATLVGPGTAEPALPVLVRVFVRLLGVDWFLRLSLTPGTDVGTGRPGQTSQPE